jgi:membrane protein
VIIFLVWLWISNIAILLGAEFNAEAQRERAIRGGLPEDLEPFAELRDTRKLDDPEKRRVAAAERTRDRIMNRGEDPSNRGKDPSVNQEKEAGR